MKPGSILVVVDLTCSGHDVRDLVRQLDGVAVGWAGEDDDPPTVLVEKASSQTVGDGADVHVEAQVVRGRYESYDHLVRVGR